MSLFKSWVSSWEQGYILHLESLHKQKCRLHRTHYSKISTQSLSLVCFSDKLSVSRLLLIWFSHWITVQLCHTFISSFPHPLLTWWRDCFLYRCSRLVRGWCVTFWLMRNLLCWTHIQFIEKLGQFYGSVGWLVTNEQVTLLLFIRHYVWRYLLPIILLQTFYLLCSSLIDLTTATVIHISVLSTNKLTLCFLERICFWALIGVDIPLSLPSFNNLCTLL